MGLKIRLARGGFRNHPLYRIVVQPGENKRDGRFLEKIGHYDPHTDKFELNSERAEYWIGQGAKASDRVAFLMRTKAEAAETSAKG